MARLGVFLAFYFCFQAVHAATVSVPATANLQTYIDAAYPGDTLVLQAGATYKGSFILRNKGATYTNYITITTSASASLPGPLDRVKPSVHRAYLARLATPGNGLPALRTEPGAHHYRLLGLEITSTAATSVVSDMLMLGAYGTSQDTLAEVPHHFTIDRCYIHGWPNANFKRGIGLNSRDTDILNSYISDFHSTTQDSQAIGGANGPGNYKIINNYLEAAGENIMFGGATPSIPNVVPTNILIQMNYLYKPLAWKNWKKVDSATYNATPDSMKAKQSYGTYAANFIIETAGKYTPVVKNIFELKNAQDVTIDGNILENNWIQADQHGVAVVLTPRVESCTTRWAMVQRVKFTRNIIRNAGGLLLTLDKDNACQTSPRTNHISFSNNLVYNLRNDYAFQQSRVIQFPGTDVATFDHNHILFDATTTPWGMPYFLTAYLSSLAPAASTGVRYTCNITQYGGGINGLSTLSSPVFNGNVYIGRTSGSVPGVNYYASSLTAVGFKNPSSYDYSLLSTSPYKAKCSDGKDPGADTVGVVTATKGVVSGVRSL